MVYTWFVHMNETQEGAVLKEIRDFLELSQDEFAHLIGSTKSTISRRENGSRPLLSLGEFVKLDNALESKGRRVRDFLLVAQTKTP